MNNKHQNLDAYNFVLLALMYFYKKIKFSDSIDIVKNPPDPIGHAVTAINPHIVNTMKEQSHV